MISPTIDWAALTPLLLVLGAAVLSVLVEAFMPARFRRSVQIVFTLTALVGAFIATMWRVTVVSTEGPAPVVSGGRTQGALGTFAEDMPALMFQAAILVCAFFAVLVMADRTLTGEGAFAASAATQPGSLDEREATEAGLVQTEVFPLSLFAVGGMLAFASANDLLTLFIALEVLSLPLYVLCATARRRRALSQEAAIKYFLLGAFSSAFFLMGAALLYGYAGSVGYAAIVDTASSSVGMDALLIAGFSLVLVGLLFKVGAAPFHSWTPDTYQGAPTPVTGFMAAGTKIAAFAAMLRFAYVVGNAVQWEMAPVLWTVIIATMLVGTVGGIVQKDIKRMLAYSSIAHAGFVLIGVGSYTSTAIASVAFYLLAYGLASVGAFAVITLVRQRDAEGNVLGEATLIEQWRGLGRSNPVLAGAMAIFLLSFAGIPLTGGFIGKYLVFASGVHGGEAVLVVLAVLASAATAFFYFRLIHTMFLRDGDGHQRVTVVESEGYSSVAIGACAIGTLLLGIVPGPVMNFLGEAVKFML
ncbi:MAG: NADH-quinone oxidoreductase subunit NuoN [Actinomycetaceae bacterium]|nr:NADH-quinone oxidoreductase subunit NuoN [Actinomycetaceae bacterium]